MKFLLTLTTITAMVLSPVAQAKVYIQRAPSDRIPYQAFLKASPERESYSSHWIKKQKQRTHQIKSLFMNAQRDFLDGDLEGAAVNYKGILAQRFDRLWGVEERRAIFFSFLRLAELEKQNEEHWLSSAVNYWPLGAADPKVFAPPLVEKLKRIRQKQKEVWASVKNPQLFKGFHSAFVNGLPSSLVFSQKLKVPQSGDFSLILLSDHFRPVEWRGNATQLRLVKIKKQPIQAQPCIKPEAIYPKPVCHSQKLAREVDIRPNESMASAAMSKDNRGHQLPMLTKAKSKSKWKTHHWIMLGVGVVATGLLLANQSGGGSSSSPTAKDGF